MSTVNASNAASAMKLATKVLGGAGGGAGEAGIAIGLAAQLLGGQAGGGGANKAGVALLGQMFGVDTKTAGVMFEAAVQFAPVGMDLLSEVGGQGGLPAAGLDLSKPLSFQSPSSRLGQLHSGKASVHGYIKAAGDIQTPSASEASASYAKNSTESIYQQASGKVVEARTTFEGMVQDGSVQRHGGPSKEVPFAERTYTDVLNDPSLSFEEMLFMFMQLVSRDKEGDIKDVMKQLQEVRAKKDAKKSGNADDTKGASKTKEASPADKTTKTGEVAKTHAPNAPAAPGVSQGGDGGFLSGIANALKGADKEKIAGMLTGIGGALMTAAQPISAALMLTGVGAPVAAAIEAGAMALGIACMAAGAAVQMGALDMLGGLLDMIGGGGGSTATSAQAPAPSTGPAVSQGAGDTTPMESAPPSHSETREKAPSWDYKPQSPLLDPNYQRSDTSINAPATNKAPTQKELQRAQTAARGLHAAMHGVGTNEGKLNQILGGMTASEIKLTKKKYVETYGRPLQADINGETSGEYKKSLGVLLQGGGDNRTPITQAQAQQKADQLNAAFEGRHNNNGQIEKIILNSSPSELKAIKKAYQKNYGTSLESALNKEVGLAQAATLGEDAAVGTAIGTFAIPGGSLLGAAVGAVYGANDAGNLGDMKGLLQARLAAADSAPNPQAAAPTGRPHHASESRGEMKPSHHRPGCGRHGRTRSVTEQAASLRPQERPRTVSTLSDQPSQPNRTQPLPTNKPAGTQGKVAAQSDTKKTDGEKPAENEKSEAMLMEELKFHTEQMSRMMQAMSGVTNAMHQTAMNSIRNIK